MRRGWRQLEISCTASEVPAVIWVPARQRSNEHCGMQAPGSGPKGTCQLLLKTRELLIKSKQHVHWLPTFEATPGFSLPAVHGYVVAHLKGEQGLLVPHPALVSDCLDVQNDVVFTCVLASRAAQQHWWQGAGSSHCREVIMSPGSQVRVLWCSAATSHPVAAPAKEAPSDHSWKREASPQASGQSPLTALNGCYEHTNIIIWLPSHRVDFSPHYKYSKFLMTRIRKAQHLWFCTNTGWEKKKKKDTCTHASSPETGCKSKLKEAGWKNDPGCSAGQCYCGQERLTWILRVLHTASSTTQSSPAVPEVPQEHQHQYCVLTVTSILQLLQTEYSLVSQLWNIYSIVASAEIARI